MTNDTKNRPVRWLVVKLVAVLCAASWAGFALAAVMGIEGDLWAFIVIAAAMTGEGLVWALAWALGLTLVETRKALVSRVAAMLKRWVGGGR